MANVIPLYKSEDHKSFNHYRPVSLLCHCFNSRLLVFFIEKFKTIYDNQFRFRKGRSTHMALMILMDKIVKSIENGEFVIGVFLDFSKAFDTVNHDVLLQKIQHNGIRGSALKWFRGYRSDKCLYVTTWGKNLSRNLLIVVFPMVPFLDPSCL